MTGKWKPKEGEEYWTIQIIDEIGIYVEKYQAVTKEEFDYERAKKADEMTCKLGNCFKTRAEAERKMEQILKVLKAR